MKVHIYLQATLSGRGSYHIITASLHELFSYCTIKPPGENINHWGSERKGMNIRYTSSIINT